VLPVCDLQLVGKFYYDFLNSTERFSKLSFRNGRFSTPRAFVVLSVRHSQKPADRAALGKAHDEVASRLVLPQLWVRSTKCSSFHLSYGSVAKVRYSPLLAIDPFLPISPLFSSALFSASFPWPPPLPLPPLARRGREYRRGKVRGKI
jgi:hypothetical protein